MPSQINEASSNSAQRVGERSAIPTIRWTRVVEWLLTAVMMAYFGVHTLPAAWKMLNTDFPNYYLTARLAQEESGTSRIYEWIWLQRQKNHREVDQDFVGLGALTPFSTLAVSPFVSLPPLEAKHRWLILNMALVLVIAALLRSVTELPLRRVLVVIALSVPLNKNFLFGQYYLLLLLVLTFAYWCYVRQRRFLSGLLVGLAVGLKIFPILYVAYFLRKKDWSAFAGGLVGTCGTVITSIA